MDIKLDTKHWLAIVALLIVFFGAWELNRQDSLAVGLWTAYQTLALLVFTICWMGLLGYAVIRVGQLAKRGHDEEQLSLARMEMGQNFRKFNAR